MPLPPPSRLIYVARRSDNFCGPCRVTAGGGGTNYEGSERRQCCVSEKGRQSASFWTTTAIKKLGMRFYNIFTSTVFVQSTSKVMRGLSSTLNKDTWKNVSPFFCLSLLENAKCYVQAAAGHCNPKTWSSLRWKVGSVRTFLGFSRATLTRNLGAASIPLPSITYQGLKWSERERLSAN